MIQVCVSGVVLMAYPLALIPDPILKCVGTALLVAAPLLSLIEGYQIYLLVTRLSRLALYDLF